MSYFNFLLTRIVSLSLDSLCAYCIYVNKSRLNLIEEKEDPSDFDKWQNIVNEREACEKRRAITKALSCIEDDVASNA